MRLFFPIRKHLLPNENYFVASEPGVWRLPGGVAEVGTAPVRSRFPLVMAGVVVAGIALIAFGPRHSATQADRQQLMQQAGNGEPMAELQLAMDYRDGRLGLPVDHAVEAQWLTRAAQAGNADAAALLGDAYSKGDGVAADPVVAQHWWSQAAKAGNSHAEAELGIAMAQAANASAQNGAGRRLVDQAALQGDKQARAYLGIEMPSAAGASDAKPGIFDRLGRLFDSATLSGQSIDNLKSRAMNGDSVAEYQLAMHYRDGAWGVAADPKAALEWLRMSANRGNPVAMQTLADAFAKGDLGLQPDAAQAQAWRQRAAGARTAAQGQ